MQKSGAGMGAAGVNEFPGLGIQGADEGDLDFLMRTMQDHDTMEVGQVLCIANCQANKLILFRA